MAVAVQRKLVSVLMDLSHKIWMPLNLVSDQEECGADVVLRQRIQHLRRVARVRTVVEGQRDLAAG